ncbi:MAG: autotransporter outer membrane beta-barrel domain-containing protein [Puniceicoccales bacterium]|nr:autotransporter outer membrane beta-barrel domain-containing protein [Puniceicoccales bacterium]
MRSFLSRRFFLGALCALAATPAALARVHNGLGEFLQLFGFTPDTAPRVLNNASVLPYGSMGNLPALTSLGEVDGVLRRLDLPYPANAATEDGRHPAMRGSWEIYALGQAGRGEFDRANDRPVFDPEVWGGGVGGHLWTDDERLAGITVSCNETRAKIHDGGGHISGEQARVRVYAALIPGGQPWQVAFGASGGYVSYDVRRFSPLNGAGEVIKAAPDGYELGIFGVFKTRLTLADGLMLTPFARIDYNNTSVNHFSERGAGTWLQDVNRFNAESIQTRLGAGLEYTADIGGALLRAATTVTWASELGRNKIKLTSAFIGTQSRHHVYAGQLFGDAVEISPSVALVFGSGFTLQAAYQIQITFAAQYSQSVSASAGWRF